MRLVIPFLFLVVHTTVFAQDPVAENSLVPRRAIKVSPLHLLSFYPTIEWSFEQRIAPRFTAQAEAGYVLNYGFNTDRNFQNKRGVKLKLEGRYYFRSVLDERKIYYLALEGYGNVINFDRSASVQECFDLDCNHVYRRQYDDKLKYREQGISVKLGMLKYLDSRTFLDMNFGFSVRNIRYKEPVRARGFEEFEDQIFFQIPNENDRVGFSPNLGLRFGYRFM